MKRLVGTKVYHFEELDSTNDYATLLLSKNKPIEGCVVITDHQTQGKGQYGRKWDTIKGQNITMSVILYPDLEASRQFDLNIITSLAVTSAIKSITGMQAQIKWPNDIYLNDKKVCGILIKNNLMGSIIHQCILGIGLNVNQPVFDPNLPNASSLFIEANHSFSLSEVQDELYKQLDRGYHLLKTDTHGLLRDYQETLWRRGYETSFLIKEEIVSGTIKGVDKNGKLIVDIRNDLKSYDMSEIKIII